MPKYRVTLEATVQETGTMVVEAENEQQAAELARNNCGAAQWEFVAFEDERVVDVDLI